MSCVLDNTWLWTHTGRAFHVVCSHIVVAVVISRLRGRVIALQGLQAGRHRLFAHVVVYSRHGFGHLADAGGRPGGAVTAGGIGAGSTSRAARVRGASTVCQHAVST